MDNEYLAEARIMVKELELAGYRRGCDLSVSVTIRGKEEWLWGRTISGGWFVQGDNIDKIQPSPEEAIAAYMVYLDGQE